MTKVIRGLFMTTLFALLMIFVLQNHDVLSQNLSLRLNLYFYEFSTVPAAIGVLLILFFLVGFAVSSMYGIYDRVQLRLTIRRQAATIEKLSGQILDKAKGPPQP
jgi:uncharacterized integral membrane protein